MLEVTTSNVFLENSSHYNEKDSAHSETAAHNVVHECSCHQEETGAENVEEATANGCFKEQKVIFDEREVAET